MRRLLAALLAAGLFVLAGPVAAQPAPQGVEVMIAVPDWIAVDGELDLVVFTGDAEGLVSVPGDCFYEPGDFPVYRTVIRDRNSGTQGALTGVVANQSPPAGTRFAFMLHLRDCEIEGINYRVYIGSAV